MHRDHQNLRLALLLVAASLATSCGTALTVQRLEPAPYNLGPARKLVLAGADGSSPRGVELVRARFLEQIDQQHVFSIEDAVPPRRDVFDFFERLFSSERTDRASEAKEYRSRHPADIYVRLRVTELESRKSSSNKADEKSFWAEAECSFQVTLIDGRDGRRLARFTASKKASSPIYDEWRDSLRETAEKAAVDGAVGEALAQFTPHTVTDRLSIDEKAPRAAEGIELINSPWRE